MENATYERYNFSRVLSKVMCKLGAVANEMRNVNVAVVLLQEHVLAYLISGDRISPGNMPPPQFVVYL
jgi:hypothetical protein